MTELIQRKYPSFSHVVSKLDTTYININSDLIMKDVEKLELALKKSKSYNKTNIKALITYLNKILKCLNENMELELAWNISSDVDIIKSYPVSLVCEEAYGINTCNYIEVSPGVKIVDIDTTVLANMIAFEFMFKDLGDTHNSIEKLLRECGVTGIEDSKILTDYLKTIYTNGAIFELSKTLKIEDSPYKIREDNTIQDYFNTKIFKANTYRDVVNHSCEYANTIVLSNIFKEAIKYKLDFKLLCLSSTRIQFEIKEFPDESIRDTIIGDVIIRVFGRRFKVCNKVKIY